MRRGGGGEGGGGLSRRMRKGVRGWWGWWLMCKKGLLRQVDALLWPSDPARTLCLVAFTLRCAFLPSRNHLTHPPKYTQQCPTQEGINCPRQQHLHSGNFVAFACSSGSHYSDLATLFFNTQVRGLRGEGVWDAIMLGHMQGG